MKNKIKKIKLWALLHKKMSVVIIIGICLVGYFVFRGNDQIAPRYLMSLVGKGTIISSISGSGQVAAQSQIDIKSKSSGDVIYVNATNGQYLNAGALILSIDSSDEEKSVRDAEINLESSKLSLEKLKKPADALSMLQAQNSLDQASSDLSKAYDDGFNTVADAFLDLPTVVTGLNDILYSDDVDNGTSGQLNIYYYADNTSQSTFERDQASQYAKDADTKYQIAKKAYDQNFIDYKNITRDSDKVAIESLINETYNTTRVATEAVKSATSLIQYYQDKITGRSLTPASKSYTHISSLSGYTSKMSSGLLSLLGIKNTIRNSNFSIAEKIEALKKLKDGPDALDISSSELSVKQKENALADAQSKLPDSYVRAPFSGTIGKLSVKKSDSISSGQSIATMTTNKMIAEISLNEVDVAKIKSGAKVTMTFDAVPNLTIAGTIANIDPIGTVYQGVVTYDVKISFDTSDERVKPGMSVSASIVSDVKQDVIAVPNSAVKSKNGSYYVEKIEMTSPQEPGIQGVIAQSPVLQIPIEIGLSNDTLTEVSSGLKEGDLVVSRTIAPSTSAPVAQAPSLFGGGNTRSAFGSGGARTPGRN